MNKCIFGIHEYKKLGYQKISRCSGQRIIKKCKTCGKIKYKYNQNIKEIIDVYSLNDISDLLKMSDFEFMWKPEIDTTDTKLEIRRKKLKKLNFS